MDFEDQFQKDLIYKEAKEKPVKNAFKNQAQPNIEHKPNHISNIMSNYVKPTVYNIVGGQNSIIRIGPQGVQVHSNRPQFPPVPVECRSCRFKQIIAGNADQYLCCQCKEMNETQPKFGLFVCYMCHNYVCYPYFTSQHIHCNICTAVNAVQKNPHKKHHPKKNLTQNKIQQKELRQVDEMSHEENGDMITVAKFQQESIEDF